MRLAEERSSELVSARFMRSKLLGASSEVLVLNICRKLFRTLVSATQISLRMRMGSRSSRAYMYSFKNRVYLSISMPQLGSSAKVSATRMTFLLMLSVLSEVKNRMRLIATVLASIALLLLNGFVPMGTLVTIVLLVIAVALLAVAFVVARNVGKVTLSDEKTLEEVHRRLYGTNLEYRDLFNRINGFSESIISELSSILRGRLHTAIHIPSFGIYSMSAKTSGDVVEIELRKVASSTNFFPQP